MTSLSRRKPRTTAPRTAAGRALSAACLLGAFAAAGGTAAAQYRGVAAPPAAARAQPQPARPAPAGPVLPPASAGKVMYFHKPADALVPVSGSGGGEPVAQAAVPAPPGGTGAFVPAPPLPIPSAVVAAPSVPDRPIPVAQPIAAQPGRTTTSQKKQIDPNATVLPTPDKIFVMYTDAELEQVILESLREAVRRQEPDKETGKRPDPYARYPKDMKFPPLEPVGGGVAYQPKTVAYPPMQAVYVPRYVVHRRLHFEEKNSERYGWDLGFVQPLVSALYFYKDVLTWPNSLGAGCAYGFWDTNAGKCLPGSPTPYMLYPPELTITGGAFEGVIVTGAAFAFP